MTLKDRILYFANMFWQLQATTSLNTKRDIVGAIPSALTGDWYFMLKVMGGHKPLGYTAYYLTDIDEEGTTLDQTMTIEKYLEPLWNCARQGDWSQENILRSLMCCPLYQDFYVPLVNKEYRLGIGNSLIEKSKLSPMLAKKFEGSAPHSSMGYFVTEKLDGNRCIAWWDGDKWNFTSRNGKPMFVEFDMHLLPKEYIYDGEVMSKTQTEMSVLRFNSTLGNTSFSAIDDGKAFSQASGMIRRQSGTKTVVYNIFDIIRDDLCYVERRSILNEILKELRPIETNIRIVPLLAIYRNSDLLELKAGPLMDSIVKMGGEGIMINLGDAGYINKRTDQLLKYKPVHTLDMIVVDWLEGFGKYEGQVGALLCTAMADGKTIWCNVGTGLSNEQRSLWARSPNLIIGKIVEVAYFSISQGEVKSIYGEYSLRFPRLKGVRNDKTIAEQ